MSAMGIYVMYAVYGVITLLGVYVICSSINMKQTQVPGTWMLGEGELDKCKDVPGFAMAVYAKTLVFGIVVTAFGVVSLLNKLIWQNKTMETVCVVVFLIVSGGYLVLLNRIKGAYFG